MKYAKKGLFHALALVWLASGCLAPAPQQFFNRAYVCNALGGDSAGSGIKGSIHYLTPDQVTQGYSGVRDFLDRGTKPEIDFYMGRLYNPTRPFAEGFKLNTGEIVQDKDGNDLIEYFAYHLTSRIRLPIGYADRFVQFALITDDGARLIIHRRNADGTTTRVTNVNNDGDHPTKMACGTAPVKVSAFEELEIEVDYYQGPRYHIALNMLWREWTSSGFNPNDAYCGASGNSVFWDSTTTPSTAQPAWTNLMTRWSVIPAEVFIPEPGNPCQ